MNMITKEALEFLNEAREQLKKNPDYTTYRSEKENFIALRTGFREDCITVYELGSPVGNFAEQLPRQHKVVVDFDQMEMYKKLQEKLEKISLVVDSFEWHYSPEGTPQKHIYNLLNK